MMSSLIKKRSA